MATVEEQIESSIGCFASAQAAMRRDLSWRTWLDERGQKMQGLGVSGSCLDSIPNLPLQAPLARAERMHFFGVEGGLDGATR
jgi:hypothetical protein